MTLVRFRLALILAGLLSQAGCAVFLQPVPLYQLEGGEFVAAPAAGEGMAVQLEPIGVAPYLQDEVLLQRQPDGSLVAAKNARWAGPLALNLSEQVLRQLAGQLNTQRLVQTPVPTGFKPDVQVGLEITRFDSGPQQPAVLEARWRLLDRDGQLQSSRVLRLVQEHQGSTADQVHAQSLLVQRLVENLAEAVKPIAERPKIAESPAKPPRSTETAPKAPLAIPIRTDVEIFRF